MKEKRPGRIPELDGLRVLMIFIVSWYHIWQQSWLQPAVNIPAAGIYWSLDFLVRTGYVWVDGTVLLSAFLLYLPLARKAQAPEGALPEPVSLPSAGDFYFRKARRILPGYWFIILVFFFGMCLPWNLYQGNGPFMVKDLFTHLTLIFPFWRDTYLYTPMGAASWTLSIVAQGYLLFPLLARCLRRKPAVTLCFLCAAAFAFRGWCLWALQDYSMVVNTFVNFLDVYAAGFGSAMLYARLERTVRDRDAAASGKDRKTRILRETASTLVFFGCLVGICRLLNVQAGKPGHAELQGSQMLLRPAFALGFAGLILSAPFSLKPLRFLLGNRVTAFLAAVSMNYYLIHQTLAVHLKARLRFPPSVSEVPNEALEQPWQTQYTMLVFGLSLLAAMLVTYLVEKPAGQWLEKLRKRRSVTKSM